jgi:hypothetical protein
MEFLLAEVGLRQSDLSQSTFTDAIVMLNELGIKSSDGLDEAINFKGENCFLDKGLTLRAYQALPWVSLTAYIFATSIHEVLLSCCNSNDKPA